MFIIYSFMGRSENTKQFSVQLLLSFNAKLKGLDCTTEIQVKKTTQQI